MFKHRRVFLAKGFAGFCLLGGSCMHFPNQSALPAKKGSLSYSFNEKPYVHPKMVWELMPWISDTDQQMLSLSVSGWEGSNRYYEAIVKKTFNEFLVFFVKSMLLFLFPLAQILIIYKFGFN